MITESAEEQGWERRSLGVDSVAYGYLGMAFQERTTKAPFSQA